jgi:Mor family transcriptional regulator
MPRKNDPRTTQRNTEIRAQLGIKSHMELAKQFGVSYATIAKISSSTPGRSIGRPAQNQERDAMIREYRELGASCEDLAKTFHLSPGRISQIVRIDPRGAQFDLDVVTQPEEPFAAPETNQMPSSD